MLILPTHFSLLGSMRKTQTIPSARSHIFLIFRKPALSPMVSLLREAGKCCLIVRWQYMSCQAWWAREVACDAGLHLADSWLRRKGWRMGQNRNWNVVVFAISLLSGMSNRIWPFVIHCGPKRLQEIAGVTNDIQGSWQVYSIPRRHLAKFILFCSCGMLPKGRETVYSVTSAYICFIILPDVAWIGLRGRVLDSKVCSQPLSVQETSL